MKLRSISKLFYRYLDQLELAAGMEHLGSNNKGDIVPCFETLNRWVKVRVRAVKRRNPSQLKFINGLVTDKRVAEAKQRLVHIAIERGLIKK